MRRSNLLGTSTFRLALIYLALFGFSVLALLGFIWWTTAAVISQQTEQTISAEITGLAEQYRRRGLPGLISVVQERSRNQRLSLYLLIDPQGQSLGGNLDHWPDVPTGPDGWMEFEYERTVGEEVRTHQAQARHLQLGLGYELLVGRDVQERREIGQLITTSLAWALALTLGLGLIGGVVMSRNMLTRIDAINRTTRNIMAGDLTQRVPVPGSGDEIDRLATNLNEMLDQIETLMNSMREVADNIAHDLRSPLNRLRSRVEVALMGEGSVEGYREALEQTVAEAEDLLHTFNALLSIARAEAGAQRQPLEPVDLADIARDVMELYEPFAEDKGLQVRETIQGEAPVSGNRHLLSQALANLIDNAIKYTPEDGAIGLSIQRCQHEGRWVVEAVVADSGPGIPEAERGHVLDRFVRLEQSRATPGSGLGLSLVRAVAHLHHAELELADNDPGLKIILRLPAREPPQGGRRGGEKKRGDEARDAKKPAERPEASENLPAA